MNGQPGALFFDREGRLISVMILDVAEGQIQGVSSIVNPDKLRHLRDKRRVPEGPWPSGCRCGRSATKEGNRLLRIGRRGTGSVVLGAARPRMCWCLARPWTCRQIRAGDYSEDRGRRIRNFNADRFEALYPRSEAPPAPTFTLPERREIKKIALAADRSQSGSLSTWSLAKLADFPLVAEGVIEDIKSRRAPSVTPGGGRVLSSAQKALGRVPTQPAREHVDEAAADTSSAWSVIELVSMNCIADQPSRSPSPKRSSISGPCALIPIASITAGTNARMRSGSAS